MVPVRFVFSPQFGYYGCNAVLLFFLRFVGPFRHRHLRQQRPIWNGFCCGSHSPHFGSWVPTLLGAWISFWAPCFVLSAVFWLLGSLLRRLHWISGIIEVWCFFFSLRLGSVYFDAPLCFSCQMAIIPSSAARHRSLLGFVLRYLSLLFLVLGSLFGAVLSAVVWLLGCFSSVFTGDLM